MWAWFTEAAQPDDHTIKTAEVELLKTAYRLDGGLHDVLTGYAVLLAGQLELTGTVTLYQELGTQERNARVQMLGDDIHVVFGGDLLELLDLGEQQAVLAHELAHAALWQRDDRTYWILDHMMHRLAADPTASEAVDEAARRLRLHTEVFADAVSAELTDDRNDVISSVVKVSSGLRTVDPEAYLRQARQVLEADPAASRGWTHPELHVRVACLAARSAADPEPIVAGLIEGPDELDRLDLLGQLRLVELTRRMLAGACELAPPGDDGSAAAISVHVDSFVLPVERSATDAEPPNSGVSANGSLPDGALPDGALSENELSVRHYCAALLVDVALAGEGKATGMAALAPMVKEARRLGIDTEFEKIMARATGRTVREIRNLVPKVEQSRLELSKADGSSTGEET